MSKLRETAGAAIGLVSFLAIWIGCERIDFCVDTMGVALMAAGLMGLIIGATVARAWHRPEYECSEADVVPVMANHKKMAG